MLRDCYVWLELVEEETPGNAAQQARVYSDAFQVCIQHGDQARASVFVERAYQCRVVCEGEDSARTQE